MLATLFAVEDMKVLAAGAASVCVQDMECVSYRSDKAECLYLSDK